MAANNTIQRRAQETAAARTSEGPTMQQYIKQMQGEIKKALPAVMTPERFSRIVLSALSTNPKLAETTPQSFLGAMMTAAQLGVEPNTPLGQADDATYQTAVMVAMLNQAMKGNVKAAAFCRELLGEDPSIQLRRDELKLSREKFQHEKAMDERTVAADEQKASLADAIQAAYQMRLKREQTGGDDE